MPIELTQKQVVTTPAADEPEVTYPLAWMVQSHINWPHGQDGTASAELYPLTADQSRMLRRNADGSDAVIKIKIDSMLTAMARCPEFAAAMPPYIAALNAYNKIMIADAEAAEAARMAEEQAEADRLAQIEADRQAAEAARLAQIEADRVAAEQAAADAAAAEAARIAEYNTPEAKAARVAAAQAEADTIAAQAAAALASATAAMTPEIAAAISLQSQVAAAQQASEDATQLAQQAQAAAAEVVRLENEVLT